MLRPCPMLEISVNLATHNRATFLEPCLVSLCEQTLDPSRYEICVVANACTDATPEVVQKIAARYPHHQIFMVEEPIPGLSRARNCGLRATRAPLVAHIDDDGTVYPDWLERFISLFSEKGAAIAVIGGEIEPIWESPKPEWITPRMALFLSAGTGFGSKSRFLDGGESASEGNSCYRRSMLEQVGGFPDELGRVGSCLLSGEHAVESRLRKNGGQIFFDPKIILRHFIHADRLKPLWLRRRLFWQGVSSVAIRQYQIRHSLPVTKEAFINLPLKPEDWDFIAQDTPEKLEESMFLFYSLGFALTLTGILQIEGASSTSENGMSNPSPRFLEDTPAEGLTPLLLRRHAFWQGVADFAAQATPESLVLPLDHGDWAFINNTNELPTADRLNRLRSLGFVLARSGFIPS